MPTMTRALIKFAEVYDYFGKNLWLSDLSIGAPDEKRIVTCPNRH
jgi:hypothetical protein